MISAVKIRKGEIQGLWSDYFQMEKLYNEIEKGKYKELVKYYDSNRDIYHLTFDKKQLNTFYKSIADSISSMRITNVIKNTTAKESEDTIPIGMSNEALEESSGIVKNAFPNPATDRFNIELEDEGSYILDLYNREGKLIKSAKGVANNISFNVSDVSAGTYILTITEKESGEMAKLKLLVQH